MIGADFLLDMRRSGKRPALGVVLSASSLPQRQCEATAVEVDGVAFIDIGCDESIDRLDLRCLVGLRCTVVGIDSYRTRCIAEKAQASGASAVIAVRGLYEGLTAEQLHAHNPWTEVPTQWLA